MNQPAQEQDIAQERDAYSVSQFCNSHAISRATFYNLLKDERAPRIMKVGRRTLISREAATAWRASLEAETKNAA